MEIEETKEPNVPIEAKIEKAVEIMQKMGVDKKTIDDFKTGSSYVDFSGQSFKAIKDYLRVDQELADKSIFTYFVVFGKEKFKNIINLLIIPDYEEDFDYLFEKYTNEIFRVYAYCYNIEQPEFSDYGSILITKNANGKFIRIG